MNIFKKFKYYFIGLFTDEQYVLLEHEKVLYYGSILLYKENGEWYGTILNYEKYVATKLKLASTLRIDYNNVNNFLRKKKLEKLLS